MFERGVVHQDAVTVFAVIPPAVADGAAQTPPTFQLLQGLGGLGFNPGSLIVCRGIKSQEEVGAER